MNQICSLSSPRAWKKLKNPRVPLAPRGKTPHPRIPMPWRANLSTEPQEAELVTSTVVTENKVPGAKLLPLEKGWPWSCYLPSICLFSYLSTEDNSGAYLIKWLWGLTRLLLMKQNIAKQIVSAGSAINCNYLININHADSSLEAFLCLPQTDVTISNVCIDLIPTLCSCTQLLLPQSQKVVYIHSMRIRKFSQELGVVRPWGPARFGAPVPTSWASHSC